MWTCLRLAEQAVQVSVALLPRLYADLGRERGDDG